MVQQTEHGAPAEQPPVTVAPSAPEKAGAAPPSETATEIDPKALEIAMESFRSEQNLPGGILAGFLAALAGGAVWAGVTVATGYQIGWMAVGVGFLVGLAVRGVGKGVDRTYGFVGAGLALFGCLMGNLLSVSYFVAAAENMALLEVLSRLDPIIAASLLAATFSPIDLLFYGIAIYQGFRLSFRDVSQQELLQKAQGGGAPPLTA